MANAKDKEDRRRPLREALGQRVREVRKKKGLSQLDLVRNADWTLSHLQKIERGSIDPRFTTLVQLAEDLDVKLSVLLRDF